MADIIPLPKSFNVRISHQRRRFKPACPVVDLAQRRLTTVPAETAYEMYLRASRIDDDEPAKAIPIYEQAIALDGRLSIAVTNLGNCHWKLHDYIKAEEMFSKALTIDPNQPEALYNLGYLTLERGQPAESIPLFRQAIAADPRFADAWFNLAMALKQTGKPARLEWQRYISLAPSDCRWVEIAKRHLA
jgi:tetratricopeptide (TPR) repeat protein